MKKILGISLVAVLAVSPLLANAAGTAPTAATTASEPYVGVAIDETKDTKAAASAAYVKGAYNAAIGAINEVAATANNAVKTVTEGTTAGAISVDGTAVAVHGLATVATSGAAADLTQDATHRLVSDTEKSTWNAKQAALTEAQLNAVNSGITSAKVTSYDNLVTASANYATKDQVTANINAATASKTGVSLAVSGNVSGTATGFVPVMVNWGDAAANTTTVALSGGTVSGTISNGATATGDITGIDVAAPTTYATGS